MKTGRPGVQRVVGAVWAFLAAGLMTGASGCAPGARPAAATAAAPTTPLFEPLPVAEIAHVEDPHDHQGKPLCQRCHFPDGRLTDAPNALCASCHRFGHGNHPVDVVQKTLPKDLPLLAGGRVACHTCHDPHQKRSVLRKPFNELCTSCHGRH